MADELDLPAPPPEPAIPAEVEAPPILEPPPPPPPPLIHDGMTFTGTGSEYFRIWIVNLALTIGTLGIYSAWAKVRRQQFFYRHTRLAGAGFDYHGEPIAILKGRMVGLVLFGLYSSMGYVGTWMTVVILIVLAALLPWLLGRSLRFRLRNSSYRGLRFKFDGTAKQAYWIFLCMPIFTILTLLLLGPFWHHRLKRYQFTNASYGRSRFSFGAEPGQFYGAHIISTIIVMGFFFVFIIAFIGLVVGSGGLGDVANEGDPSPAFMAIFMPLFIIGYVIAILSGQAITNARVQNAVWNNTRLAGISFISNVSAFRLFRIVLTNLLGTVLTLGFFRPFGQVRLARYLASCMAVVHVDTFGDFLATDSEDVAAVGEETAEVFDLDIGF